MKFGQGHVLQSAKGKIAAGLGIFLIGLVAVLAAPTDTDRVICALVLVVGSALVTRGIRQDREEKRKAMKQEEKPKKRKRK
jgi:hypothetical protein